MGKTDIMFNKKYRIPKNIDFIYANNINYIHKKIKQFPMGRDWRGTMFHSMKYNNFDKNILCLCSFQTCRANRKEIYNSVKNKKWITFNISSKEFKIKNFLSMKDFYIQLNQCKFVICPSGNGFETYRFYESLYHKAIPIILLKRQNKENIFYDKYKDLPILFLKDYEAFQKLTPEFLEEQYEILSKKFKDYHRILDLKYWLKNICDHKNPDQWCY